MNKKTKALAELLKQSGTDQKEIELITKMQEEDAKAKKWEDVRSWFSVFISLTALIVSILVALYK